jgi:hypothetical protein
LNSWKDDFIGRPVNPEKSRGWGKSGQVRVDHYNKKERREERPVSRRKRTPNAHLLNIFIRFK